MQRNCKLILVEGLCGTGKSTLAERLQRYLKEQGVSSLFYDEGAKGHPTSLNWHAFYREKEYKELLERYPSAASEIRSLAIQSGINYLIPYRDVLEFNEQDALIAELKSRELCWTNTAVAELPEFTDAIQRQWARFAELATASEHVYVLEAAFLQHQIHDLQRQYRAEDHLIEQHIQGIADQITALNPILIYLTQPSVRDQQVWIASVRSKPHFATEKNIRYMENRKRIELGLLDKLPFPAYTIDNSNLNWDEVFSKMVRTIEPTPAPSP